jgi:hypothetical protein
LRLKGSEVQGVIREAVEGVWVILGGLGGERSRARRRRRRNQGTSSDGNISDGMGEDAKGESEKQVGLEEMDMRKNATLDPLKQPPSINYPNCFSWAHDWLLPDNSCCPTTPQTRAKQRVQQAWLQQWQASAPHPANPDSIEALPGADVVMLHQPSTEAQVVASSTATN